MALSELQKLISDLPLDSEIHGAFEEVLTYIDQLKNEKSDLNTQNQELLGLLQEEQKRRNDLNLKVQLNRITGLPNHNRMARDLEEVLGTERNYLDTNKGAIIFIRLDKSFTSIQTTLKPQMTEWILYQIASRMKDVVGEGPQLYHTRENEFVILIQDNGSMKDYFYLSRRLRQEVRKPHVLSGHNIHINCHIGVALFPQHGRETSFLLQNADIALQIAEERHQDIILYHNKLRTQVIEKMDLQNSIIRALEQQAIREIGKQFEVFYQPVINVVSCTESEASLKLGDHGNWKIDSIGAEALIRWHHPAKGTIAPVRFIPIAEETGLIIPIGNWMIYSVAAQVKQWNDRGLNIGAVSVNLSPRQFHSETFLHTVQTAMQNNDLSSDQFRFELTESSLAENTDRMIQLMWQLHEQGVYFYIDDFGTGYSSLSYVHQMPVKKIKIDKSFVLGLSDQKREKVIIRTIIAMAKELGFGLVAEGVEEESQLTYLLDYGVQTFQGYFFSRPLSASKYEKFIEANQ